MQITKSHVAQLESLADAWMAPGEPWATDFRSVLNSLDEDTTCAYIVYEGERCVGGGWISEDSFDTALLGEQSMRACVLATAAWSDVLSAGVAELIEEQSQTARLLCLQSWQEQGRQVGQHVLRAELVTIDRFHIGTSASLNLNLEAITVPDGYRLHETKVGSLTREEQDAIYRIHQAVSWSSRFEMDPRSPDWFTRKRAAAEMEFAMANPDTLVMLGIRGPSIVAFWVTPVESELGLGARHAIGANIDEGSGIATSVFAFQHRRLFEQVPLLLHPTQANNRRIQRLMDHLGYDVLCHRYNFHRWTP